MPDVDKFVAVMPYGCQDLDEFVVIAWNKRTETIIEIIFNIISFFIGIKVVTSCG